MKQEQSWEKEFDKEFYIENPYKDHETLMTVTQKVERERFETNYKRIKDFIKDLEQKVRTQTIEEIRLNEFPRIYNNGLKDGLALNKSKETEK